MELDKILERFAEGLVKVDQHTQHESSNQRTGEVYLPGVKTMREPKFVEELLNWWRGDHSSDFNPSNASQREVPYPNIPRASCDLVLSTDGSPLETPEWAIEIKHIALVGNNGKNNDYGVQKILSPYLKDRSLIHDIKRMRSAPMGRRQAVVGYCFEYNFDTCIEALLLHPTHSEYVLNVREVCRKNDPSKGELGITPMIEFANQIFTSRNLVKEVITKDFEGAWRHPCGGKGKIFGWEVLPT
ncbi:MAG TPA: hypothetical protein VMW30_01595 [Candidatus Paceibacterota bacterium]|nr:hypothetical protein [Candidatus Paceibacterota bacterium]